MKLEIPDDICQQIITQARAEAPIEACGILAGRDGKAQMMYAMTNVDEATDHFMMSPEEQFAAVKAIRSARIDMLAIYHSHPESPARPSQEDIRLALTPGVIYVIVSLKNADKPDVKGFLIDNGDVTEVPVTITKG